MKIELITIGDELLDGRTRDLNIYWIGGRLRDLGVSVERVTMVDDDLDRLPQILREAAQRADLVITSGGLGPTLDDCTRDAIAIAAGVELTEFPEATARLRAYFTSRNVEMAPTNLRQTIFPAGATVYPSRFGTAEPFEVAIDGTPCISLPGVPFELQGLFEELVVPRLQRGGRPRVWRKLNVFGKGESALAEKIEGLGLDARIKITWMAKLTGVIIEFSVDAEHEALLEPAVARAEEAIAPFGFRSPTGTVAGAVAELLTDRGWRMATAESCTGGLIASTLTDLPGSSAWFDRGYVTYSNDAKATDLGVRVETLAAHGAVSEPVALEMARGARAIAQANVAVAVSGIAGPTGGTDEKPVGTVMIACVTETHEAVIHARFARRTREDFKALVTELALMLVLRTLQDQTEALRAIYAVRSLNHQEAN